MRKINNNISAAIISNIIFEPYFLPLLKSIFGISDNLEANAHLIPYDEYIDSEYKKLFVNSDLIIVWLKFEELFSDIWDHIYLGAASERKAIDETVGLCERLYADLAGYSNAHVLWFLFEDYYRQSHVAQGQVYNGLIDSINKKICDELCEYENVTFIDLKSLIAKVGIVNSYDAKGKYRWNAPYSKALIEAAVKEIHKQYLIENGITKKCLVLDCDNVLWDGILSEDGIENIHLGNSGFGRAYHQIPPYIKRDDIFEICIDINFDVFWGEYEGKRINISSFLSDAIELYVYGCNIKSLSILKAFLQLALHHYKDMNSIFLLATEKTIKFDTFKDVYYLLKNNLDAIILDKLYAMSVEYEIIPYVFYVLYYTGQVFDDNILNQYIEAFKTPEGEALLNCYGLCEKERREWKCDFKTRLDSDNLYELIKEKLTERDKEKIAINKRIFLGINE